MRMVLEHASAHESEWAAICSIAEKIGCAPETLRKWLRQSQRDAGKRPGLTTDERERLKQLERENRELRTGGARPPTEVMVQFIDEHRATYGVEPICRVLPIAPSTYYARKAVDRDPDLRCQRAKRDEELGDEIQRVWDVSAGVVLAKLVIQSEHDSQEPTLPRGAQVKRAVAYDQPLP